MTFPTLPFSRVPISAGMRNIFSILILELGIDIFIFYLKIFTIRLILVCSRLPNGHLNFEKFWQLAKQVTEFITWKQVHCPFPKAAKVITYLQATPVLNEDGQYFRLSGCQNQASFCHFFTLFGFEKMLRLNKRTYSIFQLSLSRLLSANLRKTTKKSGIDPSSEFPILFLQSAFSFRL